MKNQVSIIITSQGWDVKIKLNGKTSVVKGKLQTDGTTNLAADLYKEHAGQEVLIMAINDHLPSDLMHSLEKYESVRRCRVCGCTDEDCSPCIEKTGEPCHWVEDDLCSACADSVDNLIENIKNIKS